MGIELILSAGRMKETPTMNTASSTDAPAQNVEAAADDDLPF